MIQAQRAPLTRKDRRICNLGSVRDERSLGRPDCEGLKRIEVRLDAEPRRVAEQHGAVAHVADRTAEGLPQGVLVDVDLEQAVTPDRGKKMRRCEEADAGAEIVR